MSCSKAGMNGKTLTWKGCFDGAGSIGNNGNNGDHGAGFIKAG